MALEDEYSVEIPAEELERRCLQLAMLWST